MPRALAALLLLCACQPSGGGYDVLELGALPDAPDTPPAWAAEAIWARLPLTADAPGGPASGDPGAPADSVAAPDAAAPDAEAPDAAGSATGADTLGARGPEASALQRAIDDLGRIEALGVTALAVLPAMTDPVHIDPALGPDPEGDREMIALEDPDDPATWSTTAADGLFLDLVGLAHDRGLRVVLGASLGRLSEEAGRAAGDLGAGTDRALAAAIRWLDPDGDGDPADGVDGFAVRGEEAPGPFWRDLRRLTKAVHPDAILVSSTGDAWVPSLDVALDGRPLALLARMLAPSDSALSPVTAAALLAEHYASISASRLPAQPSVLPDALSRPDSLRSGGRTADLLRLLQATLPGAPLVPTEAGALGAAGPLALRRDTPDLWARGTLTWQPTASVLRFTRRAGSAVAVVVVNVEGVEQQVLLPAGSVEVAASVGPRPIGDGQRVLLAPRSGAVFLLEPGRAL